MVSALTSPVKYITCSPTFTDFLNQFAENFEHGKNAIELAKRHEDSWEMLNLLYLKRFVVVSDPNVPVADFLNMGSTYLRIRANPYLTAINLLASLAHEVKHYTNRLGVSLRNLLVPMSLEEYREWCLNDELEAHKVQYKTAFELSALLPDHHPKWSEAAKHYVNETLAEYLLNHKFDFGSDFYGAETYPDLWDMYYETRFSESLVPLR